jgi:hypothetical protein
MAERAEAPAALDRTEPADVPARRVLQEHALDRVVGAEVQDLVERRFDEAGHRDAIVA